MSHLKLYISLHFLKMLGRITSSATRWTSWALPALLKRCHLCRTSWFLEVRYCCRAWATESVSLSRCLIGWPRSNQVGIKNTWMTEIKGPKKHDLEWKYKWMTKIEEGKHKKRAEIKEGKANNTKKTYVIWEWDLGLTNPSSKSHHLSSSFSVFYQTSHFCPWDL